MSEHLVRVEALTAIKKARQWNDAELARALGRTQQQVRTWFMAEGMAGARKIGERLARDIEERLRIPRFSLDRGTQAAIAAEPPPHYRTDPTSQNLTQWVTKPAARSVPVVPWGVFKLTGTSDAAVQGPARALETFAETSDAARFLEVVDNSMAGIYQPGDHVLIDPAATPVAGDVVLVRSQGRELMLRMYRPRPGQAFDAIALNENYPPLHSQADELQVVGVVMEHRRYRRPSM